jgi:hypothetical protein
VAKASPRRDRPDRALGLRAAPRRSRRAMRENRQVFPHNFGLGRPGLPRPHLSVPFDRQRGEA